MLSIGVAAAGATTALLIFGQSSNVYSQIGMVMLIGLAAKNAILIVEFAKERRESDGMEITEAAVLGGEQRYRAVMMTALAFVLGLIPLVTASGAGAASRNAIGWAAIGGMVAATFIGILIVPSLFAFFERIAEGRRGKLWGREKDRSAEPHRPEDRARSPIAFPWNRVGRPGEADVPAGGEGERGAPAE